MKTIRTPYLQDVIELIDKNNSHTIIIRDKEYVQVIRCKDCRWGREVCGNIECSVDRNLPPEYHGYEWFCPNGEKMGEVNK